VKAYVKKEFGIVATGVDFTTDDVKVWLSSDDLTEREIIKALHDSCKKNISYSYKVLFPGSLVDLN